MWYVVGMVLLLSFVIRSFILGVMGVVCGWGVV